jgi:Yip1 domain
MSLGERIVALAQLTLQDPRAAARALLSQAVPMSARTSGLLLVAVVSAVLASLQAGLQAEALDPVNAFMLASPFRAAAVQWFFLALTVVLIHNAGRAFGGKGSFPDALLVVVWLQLLMLVLQALQFVASFLSPPLAGLIGLAGFVVFLWLMSSFVAELHGFASRGAVLAGIVGVAVGTGLFIGIAVVIIVGPEALLPSV